MKPGQQKKMSVLLFFFVLIISFAFPTIAYADLHITVVVNDCDTKKPISGATVSIPTAQGSPSKTTNANGQATFTKIRPGDVVHSVYVNYPKYVGASQSAFIPANSSKGFTFCLRKPAPAPTPIPTRASPTLMPTKTPTKAPTKQPSPPAVQYSISGKVIDKASKGIAGIIVKDNHGHQTKTGKNGEYMISNLLPGDYMVTTQTTTYDVWPVNQPVVIKNMSIAGVDFSELWCGTNRVPLTLQGDPKNTKAGYPIPDWSDVPLGYSDYHTIGSAGCFLSAHVMVLNYFGSKANPQFSTNPEKLNTLLQEANGYDGANLKSNEVIRVLEKASPVFSIKKLLHSSCPPEQEISIDSELTNALCNGSIAILGVRDGGHYILAHGVTQHNGILTYAISDALKGQTTLAENGYANQYCGAILYQGLYPATTEKYLAQDHSSVNITLMSPIHAVISDPEGRKLGYDPIANDSFNEIPDSIYLVNSYLSASTIENHPPKSIIISKPLVGEYTIQVFGTGTGPYNIFVSTLDETGELKKAEFSGQASPGSKDNFQFQYGKPVSQNTPTTEYKTLVATSSTNSSRSPSRLLFFGFLFFTILAILVGVLIVIGIKKLPK